MIFFNVSFSLFAPSRVKFILKQTFNPFLTGLFGNKKQNPQLGACNNNVIWARTQGTARGSPGAREN